jgi:hypothetical protein
MMALHIIRPGHRQDTGSCSLILEACATCPSASPFVSAPAKSKNSPSIHATTYETPGIRPTACITIMSAAAAAAEAEAEAETETVLPAPDHQTINQSNGAHLWSSPIFQLHIRRCGYRTSHRFIRISSHSAVAIMASFRAKFALVLAAIVICQTFVEPALAARPALGARKKLTESAAAKVISWSCIFLHYIKEINLYS